jgi:hypothetical protein
MNSPTLQAFWHGFAQGRAAVVNGFAMVGSWGHCLLAGLRQSGRDLRSLRCYPSPSSRSGPSQAGPILVGWQGGADGAGGARYCFQIRDLAVESGAITTNLRGSITCRSRLSSSLFFPRRWPVACRTQRPAAWPVQRLAPLLPMRWTKTCWPGPRWAVLPVWQLAVSRSACRPATRAIKLAAFGRITQNYKDHPGRPPGWSFCISAGGSRCLTRS